MELQEYKNILKNISETTLEKVREKQNIIENYAQQSINPEEFKSLYKLQEVLMNSSLNGKLTFEELYDFTLELHDSLNCNFEFKPRTNGNI